MRGCIDTTYTCEWYSTAFVFHYVSYCCDVCLVLYLGVTGETILNWYSGIHVVRKRRVSYLPLPIDKWSIRGCGFNKS